MRSLKCRREKASHARRIECFHSRGQHLCKFIGTKESVCIRKEFNSHRIGLGHQHGGRFIVWGHQYGRRDVMWKHSIKVTNSELKQQRRRRLRKRHLKSKSHCFKLYRAYSISFNSSNVSNFFSISILKNFFKVQKKKTKVIVLRSRSPQNLLGIFTS